MTRPVASMSPAHYCINRGYCAHPTLLLLSIDVVDDVRGGTIVATASLTDGVLPGVIRGHVIRACKALGVPVVESAPHWSSHERWREAFVTNR